MKKFISNLIKFTSAAIILIAALVLATQYFAKNTFDPSISKEKNIHVLGNSHPECVIDDSELTNFFNLALSGSGYFYDYLKAKNSWNLIHILSLWSLVISIVTLLKKNSWYIDDNVIKHKMRNHFFIFNLDDYFSIFQGNLKSLLINTPQTILHNLKIIIYRMKSLGGYLNLERNLIIEEPAKINKRTLERGIELSNEFFIEIIWPSQDKKVKLVLLSTPIHLLKKNNQKDLILRYFSFPKENMPNAILVDDSNFELPEKYYVDMTNLNYEGSKHYSNFLKQNRILQHRGICQNQMIESLSIKETHKYDYF